MTDETRLERMGPYPDVGVAGGHSVTDPRQRIRDDLAIANRHLSAAAFAARGVLSQRDADSLSTSAERLARLVARLSAGRRRRTEAR